MNRVRLPLLTLLTLTLMLNWPITIGVNSQINHLPFSDYHVIPLNRILYPRIGSPAFSQPGGILEIYVKYVPGEVGENPEAVNLNVNLTSVFIGNLKLEVLNQTFLQSIDAWRISAQVPREAETGLYNLTVYTETVEYVEPNSVFIKKSFKEPLTVAVVTDTHLGLNKGILIENDRVTERVLTALSCLSNVDVIVFCGDIIDGTADEAPYEYAYKVFVKLSKPVILTMGNNDYTTVEKGKYWWEKYFCPYYKSITAGKYYFVSMDSDTGRVSDEQLNWIQEDLEIHKDNPSKTLILHHHYWDPNEVSPNVIQRIPQFIEQYRINLVLMGHWHLDDVRTTPTLSITTVALAAGGRRGFRIIQLSDGNVVYTPNSYNWNILNVTYLQRNDGSSTGLAIKVENGFQETVNLIIPVLLAPKPASITVEGGTVLRDVLNQGLRVIQVETTVGSGESKTVKVYEEEDRTPPKVSIELQVSDRTVKLIPEASDEGLGIAELKLYYSLDNATWMEVVPTYEHLSPKWVVTVKGDVIYVKAVALDAAGLTATKYASHIFATPTTTRVTTTTTPPPTTTRTTYSPPPKTTEITTTVTTTTVATTTTAVTVGAAPTRGPSVNYIVIGGVALASAVLIIAFILRKKS